MIINLAGYSRRDLSNLLQIAQQCDNAGAPLPCWFVELIVDKHDAMLPQGPGAAPVKRPTPPCDGCKVAEWIRFPCGRYGWKCEGKQAGTCKMVKNGGN